MACTTFMIPNCPAHLPFLLSQSLFTIFLPLISTAGSFILILLLVPITPRHWRASAVNQDHPVVEPVAAMPMLARVAT
jgi:hypothetical protein